MQIRALDTVAGTSKAKNKTPAPRPRPVVSQLQYGLFRSQYIMSLAVTNPTYSTAAICNAAKTFQRTFAHDPVIRYVRNERPQSREVLMVERLLISVYLVLWIRTKIALTVRDGAADIIVSPPRHGADPPRNDHITHLTRRLAAALVRYRDSRISDLERRRRTEVDEKMQDAVVRAFGNRVENMWLIEELWTDPNRQGRGYGGALLDTAMAMVNTGSLYN
ncbi:hypothetical protein C0991_010689 [Blastosporella zonata]|nr:hypothetical protein C0991_010689 [Blastosporella zonata]